MKETEFFPPFSPSLVQYLELMPVSESTCDCEDADVAKTLFGTETKRLQAVLRWIIAHFPPARPLPVLSSFLSLNLQRQILSIAALMDGQLPAEFQCRLEWSVSSKGWRQC